MTGEDKSDIIITYLIEILKKKVIKMLDELGQKVSDVVAVNVDDVDSQQKEIIAYTVTQLLGEFIKIGLMALIACIFDIWTLLLISIFSTAIYRIPSGGVHCKGHISCFIVSSVFFFGNVFQSMVYINISIVLSMVFLIFHREGHLL